MSLRSFLRVAVMVAAFGAALTAWAVSCPVAKTHEASEAEQEFLRGHYDKAVMLYQAELQKTPNDPASVAGLAHVLLRQQKIADADALVTAAIAKTTGNAVLYTALGEVQYREGMPWLAAATVESTLKLDGCYARLRLLNWRLLRLNSMYASAAVELKAAHKIDASDPVIRRAWLDTLSVPHRITELESYLASDTGDDAEELSHLRLYLKSLQKRLAEPHKPCRLVSETDSTEIPFSAIRNDGVHFSSYGLGVKLNDQDASLQIDTGAKGLVVNHAFAETAHLTRYNDVAVNGIGNKGESSAYAAYADSIRIGALEFHDCQVSVVDNHFGMEADGLIGTDVFGGFLVSLDYPMRRLRLAPLPKRPDDTTMERPTLETSQSAATTDDSDSKVNAENSLPDAPMAVEHPKAPKGGRRYHDRYTAPEMSDWTPIYRVGHQLLMPTVINRSAPKLFVLDTGAFKSTISPAVARTVTTVRRNDKIRVYGLAGQVNEVFSADEIELQFANFRQKQKNMVAFESPAISKNDGLEIAGFLGATTLGEVTLSIDYRDGLVKIDYDPKRGKAYPAYGKKFHK